MTQDYRINTFGLTQKQNQFVSANLPVRDCELYIADTPTDLIAINCEAMIVNASAMEQDDADMIFGYYQEVNGCTDETSRSRRRSCGSSSNATIPLTPSRTSSSICCSLHTARAKKRTSTAKSWSTG